MTLRNLNAKLQKILYHSRSTCLLSGTLSRKVLNTDEFLRMSSYGLSFNSDVCGFVLLTSALLKVNNGEKIFVVFFLFDFSQLQPTDHFTSYNQYSSPLGQFDPSQAPQYASVLNQPPPPFAYG